MSALINAAGMIETQARIFDDLRTGAQVCFLIKRDGQSKEFVAVAQLESGWFIGWDKFREQMKLSAATADPAFADLQAQSSFVAYGTPDADGEVDVFEIGPEARDKVPPTETSPSWKFYLNRLEDERFSVPS